MRLSQMACFMSHIFIFQDIVEKGYDTSLIFQDDVSFGPQFRTVLPAVLDEIHELNLAWDVILLGRIRFSRNKDAPVPGSRYLVRPAFSVGATGFLMSARGAAKIMESSPFSQMTCDDNLFFIMAGSFPDAEVMKAFKSPYASFDLFAINPSQLWGTSFRGDSDV